MVYQSSNISVATDQMYTTRCLSTVSSVDMMHKIYKVCMIYWSSICISKNIKAYQRTTSGLRFLGVVPMECSLK